MITDGISDILTCLRNALMVNHQIVKIPQTKMSVAILTILKEEGFIKDFEIYNEKFYSYLLIYLKYTGKMQKPVIKKIERISKPGLKVYVSAKKLPKVMNNFGIAIVSTSKGVMTNLKAKQYGIGGEILCYIW